MNNFFKHCYWALRHGEWDIGWDKEWGKKEDEPFLWWGHHYYDATYYAAVRIGKFFIGVVY